MRLSEERIKRTMDEACCDWCGGPLNMGDRVFYQLDAGTAYCSRGCALEDQCDLSWEGITMRECICGSGLPSWVLRDARGIYCGLVCEECEETKEED